VQVLTSNDKEAKFNVTATLRGLSSKQLIKGKAESGKVRAEEIV